MDKPRFQISLRDFLSIIAPLLAITASYYALMNKVEMVADKMNTAITTIKEQNGMILKLSVQYSDLDKRLSVHVAETTKK